MRDLPPPDHRDAALKLLRDAAIPFIIYATNVDKGVPGTVSYSEDSEIVIQKNGDGKFGEPTVLCTITMGQLRNLVWVYRNPYSDPKDRKL